MSDTQETPQHLIWIKTLGDALLGIRVSLRILSEKLDMLHRLSERYELQFDWEGKFLGMNRDSPAQSLLPSHSQCLDAKVCCPLFIKWAESLWESHHEAETALREMPSWASETLNASAGQNWRAMVLRECLDRVLIWPNEKIHNLAAAKVCGDPASLLEKAVKYEPYDDWQAMFVKLDGYRGDLAAIRYEGIQDPPPKPIPTAPTGSAVSSTPLARSLSRCRTALESANTKHRPVAAMLVHHSSLGNRPAWPLPKGFETQGHHMLCSFKGPYQDPQQLFDSEGKPLVGDQPYLDTDGNPMVYPDGTPIAMHPGASRTIYFWGRELFDSKPGDYSESIAVLQSAAEELGTLLLDLPIEAKEIVWKEWPHNYRYTDSTKKGIWFDAVFELAFQNHPGSGLVVERCVWGENMKMGLKELSEFGKTSDRFDELFGDLVEHVGNPPAYWYSWFDNIGSASVAAIDLLLTLLGSVQNEVPAPMANFVEPSPDTKPGIGATPDTKPIVKRSTSKGEAREKIIGGLNAHHQYDNGSCLNTDPIQVGKFAEQIGVSKSVVSVFLKAEFGKPGYLNYQRACRDVANLASSLRILNGELTPKMLNNSLGNNDGNLADE